MRSEGILATRRHAYCLFTAHDPELRINSKSCTESVGGSLSICSAIDRDQTKTRSAAVGGRSDEIFDAAKKFRPHERP